MAARSKIAIELDLLNGEYLAKMRQSQAAAQTFAGRLKTSLRAAAAPLVAIQSAISIVGSTFHLLARTVGYVINVTEKQNIAELQLAARLKSTNSAAGLAKEELFDMAKALQEVTTYGDETVIEVENLILTFTNIGKEVMPQTLETVLDMSTALGQDLKQSAIQLGKALNDPILGVTALRRVGVQLTETQEEQIRTFMKLGDTVSAQKIILKELRTQMGGAARTEAKSLTGQIQQLKNQTGDLAEEVGSALIPSLLGLVRAAKYVIHGLKDLSKWIKEIYDESQQLADSWFKRFGTSLKEMREAMMRATGSYIAHMNATDELDKKIDTIIPNVDELNDKLSKTGMAPAEDITGGGTEKELGIQGSYWQRMYDEISESINGVENAFVGSFRSIDEANRQLTYDLIWGEGGWKSWHKQMAEILKNFVADVTYTTAKLIALKAAMTAIGFATLGPAGGGAAGLLGFKRGYVPVLQGGHVPTGHVPAYIDPQEAIINRRSTQTYNNLLRAINENPQGGAGNAINISFSGNIMDKEYVDGYVIPRLQEVAKNMGATVFTTRSKY